MKIMVVAAMAALCCAGCTMSGVVPTSGQLHAPKPAATVKILFAEPKEPHEQLAIVSVTGGSIATESQLYRKLQAAAAKLGADAVIVGAKDSAYWTGKNVSGSAIKFR